MPKTNRATKNPAIFCVMPSKVATTPQTSVSVGSHNLGEVSFNTMLHGTYTSQLLAWSIGHWVLSHLEQDIANKVKSQAGKVLISSYSA